MSSCNPVLEQHHAQQVLLICQAGTRAKKAAQQLAAIKGVQVVEGGTEAWVAAQLPVVRGRGVISLERQVHCCRGLGRGWVPVRGCGCIHYFYWCRALSAVAWSLLAFRIPVAWAWCWRRCRGTIDRLWQRPN